MASKPSAYPVVDPDPSMSTILANFRAKEFGVMAAFTTGGFATGWFTAIFSGRPFRFANSRFLAGIGLLGGISYAAIGVMQRFTGVEPNRREVELYGALTDSQLKRRMDNLAQPGIEFIDSNHDQNDPFEKVN